MPKYNASLMLSKQNLSGKNPRTALKVFLGIIIFILILIGGLIAFFHNTISIATGKGNVKVSNIDQIKSAILNSNAFNSVDDVSGANGSRIISGTTKDGAVSYTIIQQKNGSENVSANIDLNKLNTDGINKSDLLNANLSAISKAKTEVDKYIEPIVGKSQAAGLEAYVANQILIQSKNNPNNILINHEFGNVKIILSSDWATKRASLVINQ